MVREKILFCAGLPNLILAHTPKGHFDHSGDAVIAMTYFELAAHAHQNWYLLGRNFDDSCFDVCSITRSIKTS